MWSFNINPWKRGWLFFHLLTLRIWDMDKQRIYRYSRVLCARNAITQSITVPVILQKKFLLVVNKTSIPCILYTLEHVEKFWSHSFTHLHTFLHEELRSHFHYISGVPRGGLGCSTLTPPLEIPKISVESSIAQARRTAVSISICSSLCSHTVVIY